MLKELFLWHKLQICASGGIGSVLGGIAGTFEGGSRMNQNIKQENSASGIKPQKPKWDGLYFTGTEEEAIEILLRTSKITRVETMAYETSRGYFFEPITGSSRYELDVSPNGTVNNYNKFVKEESSNTIRNANRYTYFTREGDGSVYMGNIFQRARIRTMLHTHPRSTRPSRGDKGFVFYFGIKGVVAGWNGVIYRHGGPDDIVYVYY